MLSWFRRGNDAFGSDAEMRGDVRLDASDVRAGLDDLRQQMTVRQCQQPVRPAQMPQRHSRLQRIVIIADAGLSAQQRGEPVGLMQKIGGGFAARLLGQPEELGETGRGAGVPYVRRVRCR